MEAKWFEHSSQQPDISVTSNSIGQEVPVAFTVESVPVTASLPYSDLVLAGIQAAASPVSPSFNDLVAFSALMNDIITLPVSTISHIPRKVRPLVAQVLTAELRHACRDGIWGFVRLSLFPKAVLRTPPRGGKKKRYVVGVLLSSRLRRWQQGDLVALWAEVHADAKPYSTDPFTTALANSRRTLRIAQEGRFNDAMCALGASGCASPENVGALNDLLSCHPQNPLPEIVDRDRQPSVLSVDSEAVLFALQSFLQGSSLGGSCLRLELLF